MRKKKEKKMATTNSNKDRHAKEWRTMEALPNEIWMQILETGIDKFILSHTDLCSLSISSKHLNSLSNQETLWSTLLTHDFPPKEDAESSSSSSSSSGSCSNNMKALYKQKLQLRVYSDRLNIHEIRTQLPGIARKLKRKRGQLMKQKERLVASHHLSDAEEAWYNGIFEEIGEMEKKHATIKLKVSEMRAYYRKRYGKFDASNAAVDKELLWC